MSLKNYEGHNEPDPGIKIPGPEVPEFHLKNTREGVELFVRAYLTNGNNATAAGRVIGIEYGASFLKNKSVQAELKRQLKYKLNALEITEERILSELFAIATLDPADLFNDDGSAKALSDIPEKARRAIAGLEVKELFARSKNGEAELIGHLKKFNVSSKLQALDLLGKYIGLWQDKIKIEHTGEVKVGVDKFELESRVKQLVEAQLGDALQ